MTCGANRFLNPKNDIAFKKIFGTEQNKDILIHFLNDVLGFKGLEAIQTARFLNPIQNPRIASQKQSMVDILCEDGESTQYIIEMQATDTGYFLKWAQYYAAKAYSEQLEKRGEYKNLKEIIFIGIMDCVIFPDKEGYKSDHVIWDRDRQEHDLEDFSFTFIELPKFKKTDPAQLESLLEKWCYFLKYADEMTGHDLEKLVGSDAIIKRAYDALDQHYWTDAELKSYDAIVKRDRDYAAAMDTAVERGLKQGLEKGLQKGLQKGREEGEQHKALAIAQAMRAQGFNTEMIQKITGLPGLFL